MAIPAFVAPLAGGLLGAFASGKGGSRRQDQKFEETRKVTPFDWDEGREGNQGLAMLNMLGNAYEGLLGRGLGPSKTYSGLMHAGLQDFYRSRGGIPKYMRREQNRNRRRG